MVCAHPSAVPEAAVYEAMVDEDAVPVEQLKKTRENAGDSAQASRHALLHAHRRRSNAVRCLQLPACSVFDSKPGQLRRTLLLPRKAFQLKQHVATPAYKREVLLR